MAICHQMGSDDHGTLCTVGSHGREPTGKQPESAELLENDGECKYTDADILPKYQDTAPFDIFHAELANYPCDRKCGKRSPRGFYLRHNDALSRNGLDDCWCEQCMVEVVAPFAYTDRDYLARFMDQWTRVEPRRENAPPFVSKRADQLHYACCMCEHVPEKVAYRVKEDESVGTKPGIYCEPCANREIVYLVRRASEFETLGTYWTREQLAAKGEEVAKRFERDPELSKICASIAPYFNTPFYSQWPPKGCQSCFRTFHHHEMSCYFTYIPQLKAMGVACHHCARNAKEKALLKFDGFNMYNSLKYYNESTPCDQLSRRLQRAPVGRRLAHLLTSLGTS
eukprot:jgi/Mesvir1/26900/Mv20628-RA.1